LNVLFSSRFTDVDEENKKGTRSKYVPLLLPTTFDVVGRVCAATLLLPWW